MSENHSSAVFDGTGSTPANQANQNSVKTPEREQNKTSQNMTQITETPVKNGSADGVSAFSTLATPTRKYNINFIESRNNSASKRKARPDSSEFEMSDSESQADALKKKLKKTKRKEEEHVLEIQRLLTLAQASPRAWIQPMPQ